MNTRLDGPWTDGPKELIQHAVDHLDLGGDFDRRIAMVSIDNAVELTIKTFLGLPERIRGYRGPTRKVLEEASESFPALLDLLETHASQLIIGLSLGDIDWYHRLRNQLYHSGNGITVDSSKVEIYLQLATSLFQSLFGIAPVLHRTVAVQTNTGHFLQLWNIFEQGLRRQLPKKEGFAYFWKRDYLRAVSEEAVSLYESVFQFRNELVHDLSDKNAKEIGAKIVELKKLIAILKIDTDG